MELLGAPALRRIVEERARRTRAAALLLVDRERAAEEARPELGEVGGVVLDDADEVEAAQRDRPRGNRRRCSDRLG
ncbi:MAG: hypothetical protein EXS13_06770 [Planctomycetes bacterium]|nr:hypothetical protein [Planctomycetota bacterium]